MRRHVILGRRPFVIRPDNHPGPFPVTEEAVIQEPTESHAILDVPTVRTSKKPKKPKKPQGKERVDIDNVTFIIVNFKTAKLTRLAVSSLLTKYKVSVILIDNGSQDKSSGTVKRLGDRKCVRAILNKQNKGHGPALHQAIQLINTEFFFAMDSDCEVRKGGFLERMLKQMAANPNLYALGWRRWVDRGTGVPLEWHTNHTPKKRFVAYAHPAASLYRTAFYRELSPFIHHGAPTLHNMIGAEKHGFDVAGFPIFDYIKHLEAGTRRMYGGRWNPKDGEKPTVWRKDTGFPI